MARDPCVMQSGERAAAIRSLARVPDGFLFDAGPILKGAAGTSTPSTPAAETEIHPCA